MRSGCNAGFAVSEGSTHPLHRLRERTVARCAPSDAAARASATKARRIDELAAGMVLPNSRG